METDDKKLRLKILCRELQFVLPYIRRELPEVELLTEGDDFDRCVAVVTPDEAEGIEAPTVLICPNVVGTRMKGLPMQMAEMIASGRYYHIPGSEARLSTVHASDVARAVALAMDTPGRFTVTDGDNPTFHDLAEALAYRLKDKRIYTAKYRLIPRLTMGALYRTVQHDQMVFGVDFASCFDFHPTPVVQYLRAHVYDDERL